MYNGIFLAILVLTVIIYDVIVLLWYGQESTITLSIRYWNSIWPLTGVLLGMLIGGLLVHLFGL